MFKDEDFDKFKLNFTLSARKAKLLQDCVESDTSLLLENNITDYSILVSIYDYKEEIARKYSSNYRIFESSDKKYIYVFSIIDFLTV